MRRKSAAFCVMRSLKAASFDAISRWTAENSGPFMFEPQTP
jgi:hypothetical protein